MAEAKLMGKLKDGREVYEIGSSLDKQILAFKDKGIKAPYLATPEQVVQIRLDKVHTNGSKTSYAPAKVKGKPTIITANSLYMDEAMARVAMQANELGEYPSLPDVFYEALEDIAKRQLSLVPEDRSVHILEGKPNSDGIIILTPEMPDAKFLLKKFSEEYFKRFNHKSINFYDILDNAPKNKTNVNYLWFNYPQNGSELNARYRVLHDDSRASGVLDKTAEGSSQNSAFTLTDVRDSVRKSIPQICQQTGLTGIEEKIASPSEKIILANLTPRIQ